jgi:2'-5' RNA ligase
MRLFVSVDLPDRLGDAVRAVQERFTDADGLDRTDPTQAHLTLKFLGEVDPERTDDLVAALETAVEAAGVAPFEATFGGLGAFPSEEYIRVVWLGVRDDGGADRLATLADAVERETTALGFDERDHAFTPHVTLARMRHAGGKDLVQRVLREADPEVGTATVEELRLTESDLTDDGPEYTTVARVSLA